MAVSIVNSTSISLEHLLELSASNVDAMLSSFPALGPSYTSPTDNSEAVQRELDTLSTTIVHEHYSRTAVQENIRLIALIAGLAVIAAMILASPFLAN